MKIEELIFLVKSSVNGGSLTIPSNFPFTDLEIEFKLNQARSTLLASRENSKGFSPDQITQVLDCLAVEPVDRSTCPAIVTNCSIYRTTKELPRFLDRNNRDCLDSVYPANLLTMGFDIMSYEKACAIVNYPDKFNKRGIAFLFNGYVYIVNYTKLLKKISLYGIFDNPREVWEFENADGSTACSTEYRDYPLNMKYSKIAVEMVADSIRKSIYGPIDNSNDSKFDPEMPKK